MSGFEIAGVVLSSLPLVISAFEHYAEGVATAKRFWMYKTELRKLLEAIKTERVIYRNTCEQLLTGVVAVDQMQDFLDNPGGELWHDSNVGNALRERLRDCHEVCIDNIRNMEKVMNKIMEKLKLGPDGKAQFSDPSAFKEEYRRLKFGISRSQYEGLLSDLRSYNQALAQLTDQSRDLEKTRGQSKSHSCPNFKALQIHARRLYTTIRSGWRCGCREHTVNLRLESRSQKVQKEEDVLEQIPFRVIFSYGTVSNSASAVTSSWQWKEADIRFIKDNPKCVPLSPFIGNNQTAVRNSNKKRRVCFDNIELPPRQTTIIETTHVPQPTPALNPTTNHIQDLCKAIATLQQQNGDNCMGYLLDELQRKYGIYLRDPPITCRQRWTTYSLKDILAQNSTVGRPLTKHDALKIAVHLASSVLQLYKTPWLVEDWGKEDILFIHRPGASLYDHPFVSCGFSHLRSSAEEMEWVSTGTSPYNVIRNQTLFTLGILLIELWYGKSMDDLKTTDDTNNRGTPNDAWCTANRLIKDNEIRDNAGFLYAEAIERCIWCDFGQRETDLEDEKFQKIVYERVVALLQKNLRQFTGEEFM
ncbi:hypothetical protein K469DRAFT_691691 [Zopfia rhizophila CBS 207.26]|uniref:DUF7580 domain-containing protein n=1 Tax=Zopfia rhizophila CBS 207.26 TaxID=1314779 RepID=A0A6A6DRB4_9PEZI|nr:hypothetical protein K469DRAFT_691691 [Zopfia rhizophila CBS 207.26]